MTAQSSALHYAAPILLYDLAHGVNVNAAKFNLKLLQVLLSNIIHGQDRNIADSPLHLNLDFVRHHSRRDLMAFIQGFISRIMIVIYNRTLIVLVQIAVNNVDISEILNSQGILGVLLED